VLYAKAVDNSQNKHAEKNLESLNTILSSTWTHRNCYSNTFNLHRLSATGTKQQILHTFKRINNKTQKTLATRQFLRFSSCEGCTSKYRTLNRARCIEVV